MNFFVKHYIDFTSGILSHILKWQAQRRLRRIGLYLDFGKLPDGWIQAIPPTDLTAIWHKSGLQIEGVGYSTIGAITESHISSRFIPDSPYYQAWLGGYLIRTSSTFGLNKQGEPIFF